MEDAEIELVGWLVTHFGVRGTWSPWPAGAPKLMRPQDADEDAEDAEDAEEAEEAVEASGLVVCGPLSPVSGTIGGGVTPGGNGAPPIGTLVWVSARRS